MPLQSAEKINKKVGLFIDVPYGIGGAFQYNQQILSAVLSLPQDEFEVTIFYVDEAWEELIPSSACKIKIKYPVLLKRVHKILFTIGLPYVVMRFAFLLSSLRKIDNAKFSLVLFPSQDLAGLFLSKNSINVVYDLMHRYEPNFKESSGGGRMRYRDRLFGQMALRSQVIFVDSVVGKNQFLESYPNQSTNIEILPYVAPPHIVEYEEDGNNVEYFKNLNLPEKFIFYPAQYWPHKNHIILLEATIEIRERIENFHLVFTGPQSHNYQKLNQFCLDNNLTNNVTFLDYIPNERIGGLYLRSQAMIMPTFYGPTNIPPLEAIALGCPVAVSAIYGMPNQLGDAALYFDNTNLSEVSRTLITLWDDNEIIKSLKANGKKHLQTWNKNLFEKLFLKIIKKYA